MNIYSSDTYFFDFDTDKHSLVTFSCCDFYKNAPYDLKDIHVSFRGSFIRAFFSDVDDSDTLLIHKVFDSFPHETTFLTVVAFHVTTHFPPIILPSVRFLDLSVFSKDSRFFAHLLDNLPVSLEIISLNIVIPVPNPPPSLKIICFPYVYKSHDTATCFFDAIPSLQLVRFGSVLSDKAFDKYLTCTFTRDTLTL